MFRKFVLIGASASSVFAVVHNGEPEKVVAFLLLTIALILLAIEDDLFSLREQK